MTSRSAAASQAVVEVLEVEGLVQLVGAHVVGQCARRSASRPRRRGSRSPGYSSRMRAPVAVDLVHAVLVEERHDIVAAAAVRAGRRRGRRVGQARGLDQAVGDVDAEAVDAHVQPEAQERAELVAHGRVVPVEVGLLGREEVQVPLARGAVGSVTRVQAGPPKMDSQSLGGSSPSAPLPGRKMVARRAGRAGALGERRWNHSCWSEEWLGTRSTMIRRPRPCASRISASASAGCRTSGRRRGSRRRRSRRRPAGRRRRGRARRRRRRGRQVRQPAVMPARSPMPSPLLSAKLRG